MTAKITCKFQKADNVNVFYREAMRHPERMDAIISQNGNCYKEGLGKKWEVRAEYWAHPAPELRKQYASAYDLETIKVQYTFGLS